MRQFFLISIFFAIDQISKILARQFLTEKKIFGFLQFVENSGIAFSIEFPRFFLIFLTIFLLIFLHFFFRKKNSCPEIFAKILLFSGAAGNLCDRIFRGKVTDFLAFFNFPIFNFADIFIFFGVAIIFLHEIWPQKITKNVRRKKNIEK